MMAAFPLASPMLPDAKLRPATVTGTLRGMVNGMISPTSSDNNFTSGISGRASTERTGYADRGRVLRRPEVVVYALEPAITGGDR